MGRHLVKAKTAIRFTDDDGVTRLYLPGDFLYIRNQTMRELLATEQIEQPCEFTIKEVYNEGDCGAVIAGNLENGALGSLPTQSGALSADLPYPRTLFWDTSALLRRDLIPIGFDRLDHGWQLAVPLYSYQRLATEFGSSADRAATQQITGDLRVLCYDYRVIFARRCSDVEKFFTHYLTELTRGREPHLAFLRALHITRPLLCALPVTWIQ
jgi:hypothetical protein